MARIGGRNAWIAWPVGIICLAVVLGLVWLALPMFPAAMSFVTSAFPALAPAAPEADGGAGEDAVYPTECRGLYSDALWASLSWEPDAQLTQDASPPVTSGAALAEALAPQVVFTCTWRAGDASVSTTLASVGTDAGAIAAASLPALGFTCANITDTRVRCEKVEGEVIDTLEFGEGKWLSTQQTSWHPERYAGRVAEEIWPS